MYAYTQDDKTIVRERVTQFRDQVRRRLSGELSEDEFRPLRLMNGLYLQRHAYMLRVAVPYGLLSSEQTRKLAYIARTYDRGYGHITTRQNIQYNWPKLAQVPDLLDDLADVEMHAIQTSGNCIRNISADHLAGVAADELEDPRPWAELLRQWSTFHPEFSFLPRKFKLAFTGATRDRAAVQVHDIGYRVVRDGAGEVGFQVLVGGGLGRTPILGKVIREFLPWPHLVSYTEAILRVYNLHGDRKNKYKARIKILVRKLGAQEFARQVEEEWEHLRDTSMRLTEEERDRVKAHFAPHPYRAQAAQGRGALEQALARDVRFQRWYSRNTSAHKVDGYRVVHISLKSQHRPPGDITADQLDVVADLAERYSFSEVRATHEQNLVLADVAVGDVYEVFRQLDEHQLGTPNIGTITDLICCPGLDYCALANAGSIGVAKMITDRFDEVDQLYELGDVKLKMSGCINACGHHHVGHIGILGVNKNGEEFYQIMLGGSAEDDASLGKWLGQAIAKEDIADAVETVLEAYVGARQPGESFLETYRRLGRNHFKEAVYGAA
ncbi:MAG: nitrite/sulfite reductase [Myxococcota bacterium]